jgi:putative colanic acid biosynthesis UDP-glucose lipid carrier transferase
MVQNNHGLLRYRTSTVGSALLRLLDPLLTIGLLWVCTSLLKVQFAHAYILLSITTVLLFLPIFKAVGLYERNYQPTTTVGSRILSGWVLLIGVLLLLGFVTQSSIDFSRPVLVLWSALTPLCLGFLHWVRHYLKQTRKHQRKNRSAVIAGVNDVSEHLIEQMQQSPDLRINLHGSFDDISCVKTDPTLWNRRVLGTLEELPEYVRQHRIDVVYITCPITDEDRIASLLKDLQNATACVYFVPNLLVFNLLKARAYELDGIPLISVWEIPFSDLQSLYKRMIDILGAGLALMFFSPIMLTIALAIKLSSPGPIIFRQRRYGLNGQQIVVYKFRSMKVMEDDETVKAATRNDHRVTKIGAFLRKTSLDELPQLINVLQGRMSLVGPRPHAVVHNEMYRQLIDGYMLRHKVKPGMTGLAQVNGFRGETNTLDQMQKRVHYDLEYLNNWSLWLDLQILLKTPFVLLGPNAY